MDLMLVSQTLIKSKECITAQVLDVLLCHFQLSKVPSIVEASTFRSNPSVEKCIGAHVGLAVLYAHRDAIAAKDVEMLLKTTWPGVFCWMQYFYTACVTKQLGSPEQNQSMLDNLIGMLLTFFDSSKRKWLEFRVRDARRCAHGDSALDTKRVGSNPVFIP